VPSQEPAPQEPAPQEPCAASWLLAGLLHGGEVDVVEVVRTPVSVHYETGDAAVPVLTVCTPDAVRLPNSLLTPTLPGEPQADRHRTSHGSTRTRVGAGGLRYAETTWRVRRWWRPPRPAGLPRPTAGALRNLWPTSPGDVPRVRASYDGLSPSALVGTGPGLTPAGDDVLAGALVAAHATDDPRLPRWQGDTRRALADSPTTAVSRAMLHHALDGYATTQLADFVTALCLGQDTSRSVAALLAVGHSSGSALLAGVLHTLSTHHLEGAA
jgi:hypothetical protein